MRTFYQDGGHGWLTAKKSELIELELINKISRFSYEQGHTVYLEEDCDMTVFINAWELNTGKKWDWDQIKRVYHKGKSFIRSLNDYHLMGQN
jgi:hypothetical protein